MIVYYKFSKFMRIFFFTYIFLITVELEERNMDMEYTGADRDHWTVFEWFKNSNSLYHWILLVIVPNYNSEQTRNVIKESLKDLKREIKEIFNNEKKSHDEHFKLISECHNYISSPNNKKLKDSLF